MVYMSGGGVQIFSLMIVFQLIKGAISGISSVNQSAYSNEGLLIFQALLFYKLVLE